MWITKIKKFLTGFIKIEIEGIFIERFINICRKEKIILWGIKRKNREKITAKIGVEDFKKIRKIVKKTNSKIKINRKQGLIFTIKKYKKRKVFIYLFLLIIISIFTLSNFIWNIEIDGLESIEKTELIKELEKYGLKQGMLKQKIDTNKVIKQIRLENEKIAWIGINIKGTNAKITVHESTEKPEIINEEEYCNIVSEKEGIITKISSTKGTSIVKQGDVVEKGDILIGGWIEGTYTGIRYMHASGEIEAKVWYTLEKEEYFNQEEKVQTNKKENKYGIVINKKTINFYKSLSKFEKYDTMKTNNKIKLFNNFYLPIEIKKVVNSEYKIIQKEYTEEELKVKIQAELEEQMKEKINEKEIINRNFSAEKNGDKLKVKLTYEVLEKIGVEEKLVS